MDSDSDSDGSHISATPPREPSRGPSFRVISSRKAEVTARSSSSGTRPKKQSPVKQAKETLNPSPAPPILSPLSSSLPFQILLQSDKPRAIPALDSVDTVPAGFFSKVLSFSKFRRDSLSFENDELPREGEINGNSYSEPHGIIPDSVKSTKRNRPHLIGDRIDLSEPCKDMPDPIVSAKRKHLNLIGGEGATPPVKIRKNSGASEGNFVKLNLNGKRRRFSSKCKTKGRSSYKFRKRSGKKSEVEKESQTEIVCDEDGFVEDNSSQNLEQKEEGIVVSKAAEEVIVAARNEPSDENLVSLLGVLYGYDSFRDGQLEAIKMVLDGRSTMLILPTGAGKSLCYQIPAMILPGITVVVSPLVALMIDQLKQLPPVICGGLLNSSQRPEEVAEALRQLKEGMLKVLFISPERLMNEEFLTMLSATVVVSLVVVDEAHCVSEWSHNFRPSYTRLRASMLRAKLNAKCILAMTATATTTTLQAVMSALEIPSTNLIQKAQIRENLHLSLSLSGANRMKDLLMLLKSSPFNEVRSIIVYCKFQSETDTISKYLRDNSISAKSYHSGLFMKDRSRVQELFCANKIRVVVATVAFGMGLDKSDVGAVIHYSLPESLEEYVQEIGRAGRDGKSSYCHLFYDDKTYFKLRSLMHSEGVDEYAVSKFLKEVFSVKMDSHGKVCSLGKESASRRFDMKEEVMLTLLTHLELSEVQYLQVLPQLNVTCALNFYKTSPGILAQKDSLVAAILKKSEIKQGQYVFDIPTLASILQVTPTGVSNRLQNLKIKGEITYEVKDPAFCYKIVEFPKDFCSLSVQLTNWLSEIERCKVRKLDAMAEAAVSALKVCNRTQGCSGSQHSPCLQRKILCYFNGETNYAPNKMTQSSRFLRADIKVFLQSNSQAKFTPRAIARIMHGIGSPAYPSSVWSKTHFWGRYMNIDFPAIMEAAKAELLTFVGKEPL